MLAAERRMEKWAKIAGKWRGCKADAECRAVRIFLQDVCFKIDNAKKVLGCIEILHQFIRIPQYFESEKDTEKKYRH